jgi:outer membrane protein assembly factor BamB
MKPFPPNALAALALACLLLPAGAADWPAYRHDARRSNVSEEGLAFPLQERWRQVPAQAPRPAWPEPLHVINRLDFDYAPHPVSAGGLVFTGSSADDTLRAFDLKTGEVRWHFVTGGPVRFPPQFDAGRLYAGSDDGFVYCLDAATGAMRWKFRAAPDDDLLVGNGRMMSRWPVRTGVLVEEGTVYFAAGMWNPDGIHVIALKADHGSVVWRNDNTAYLGISYKGSSDPAKAEGILKNPTHQGEFGTTGATPQGAPLADHDVLLIPNGISFPSRFDRRTGEYVAWEERSIMPPGTGGLFGGTWGCIDGSKFYSFGKHRADILVIAGFSTVKGSGPAVASKFPGVVPQVNIMPAGVGSQYRPKDYVHDKGKVSALVKDGKGYARHAYGLAMAGKVLLIGLDGAIVAEDAASGKELWRAPVEGQAREIAVAGGCLLVGTDRGVVHCFASGVAGAPVIHRETAKPAPAAVPAGGAEVIARLRAAGIDSGFAMISGDPDAALSLAVVAATRLNIVNVVEDETEAARLRERLVKSTALYGSRIHVVAVPNTGRLPFGRHFANAVILGGLAKVTAPSELYRVLRPCGGVLLTPGLAPADAQALLAQCGAPAGEVHNGALIRGRLPGALDWDRAVASDKVATGPMRVLWFGGPDTMQTQHFRENRTGQPVVGNGRYFVMGEKVLTAVDAYNGSVPWVRTIPRKYSNLRDLDGVLYNAAEPAPMEKGGVARGLHVLNAETLSLMLDKSCWRGRGEVWMELDARTGEQSRVIGDWTPPPIFSLQAPQTWPLEVDAAHSGSVTLQVSPLTFTVTLITKDPAVSPLDSWELFFDFRPADQRCGLYQRGTFQLIVTPADDSSAPAGPLAGNGPVQPAAIVTRDRTPTGTKTRVSFSWAELRKLTGTRASSFGFAATLNAHDPDGTDTILRRHLFGDQNAEALNNGWANVFFDKAPASVPPPANLFPPETITKAMRQQFNAAAMLRNPAEMDDPLATSPRIHPLTGELEPKIYRSGTTGCGGPYYSASERFGRAAGMLGLYDFKDDSGLRTLCGIKAGCSTPMISALGMLIIPPEGDHCVCAFPFQTTVALAPADKRLNEDWAIFHDRPVDTLVRQAAINLGAYGDRRDESGTLWLGYPRPADQGPGYPLAAGTNTAAPEPGVWMRHLSPALQVPLKMEYQDPAAGHRVEEDLFAAGDWLSWWMPNRLGRDFGPYRANTDVVRIEGTTRPWIYGSGCRGIRQATFQLDFRKTLAATPAAQPPVIDGKLTEPEWGVQPQATLPFTKTDVFLRQDAGHLYVAMKRPPVLGRLGVPSAWSKGAAGEDMPVWEGDSAEVFFSDAVSGKVVHLGVSASGARYDALCDSANTKEERAWNGPWKSAVTADESGLAFELAIPLKTLAEAGLQTASLSVNFQMNQRDISGEALRFPGGGARDWKPKETSGEAQTWLGLEGRAHCRNFTPLGLGAPPALQPRPFAVRLHFAELDDVKPGERVFDVKLQDKVVLKALDVVSAAGGPRKALVREFPHVLAGDTLKLEFTPTTGALSARSSPILSGLEFFEEGFTPPAVAPAGK